MLGILLAILSTLAYGSSGVFARLGLQYFKPLNGAILSLYASVAAALVVTLSFESKALIHVSLAALLWFAMVGSVHFAAGRYFSYLGVGYIGASRAAALRATSPLISMILAVVLLSEVLTIPIFLGTVLIVAGSYLLVKGG